MAFTRGLPIAAYLGAMVALALAAAFIAVLAIVIWLPPRPPAVMRADEVSDQFNAGYEYAVTNNRPMANGAMAWRVQTSPPRGDNPDAMAPVRGRVARELGLEPDRVRVAAANVVRSDVFVFRVRGLDQEVRRHMEEARRHGAEARRMLEEHRVSIEAGSRAAEEAAAEAAEAAEAAQSASPLAEGRAQSEQRVFEFRPSARAPAAPSAPPGAPAPPAPPVFAPAPAGVMLISGFEIGAQLPDGRWLVMRQGRNWEEIGWIGRAAAIIGAALAVLSLLLWLFARRLTRPIRSFADAVQAVGVDPQSAAVREEGPAEMRGAARAVNAMQARLRALIADRTKTLAAVAHDMRTPLMRLRLAAEHTAPEQRERMAKDIGEVEALVASFIAFARDDPAEEARVRLDLAALLQSIADDHIEAGRDVRFEGEERLVITGQSLGLKRLFSNLVDNALKYGSRARIAMRREGGVVIVDVADDGPGVPHAHRETVFEPFVRLNEEGTRGAGLGLAAARSIARAHGGDVTILDTERGALLRVTLPG